MPKKNNTEGFVSYAFHRPYVEAISLRKSLTERVFDKCQKLSCMDLKAHFGCVNAIEFSQQGDLMSSGGDDKRVLLWQVEKMLSNMGEPISMKGEHHSNIFCLGFDNTGKKLYSGGNDEQVVTHDLNTGETLDVFLHSEAVYCLSIHPENGDVFASAGDDGRILIYDTRQPATEEPTCLANYTAAMHSVMYNPVEPRLVASANSKEGIALWDVRKPGSCLHRFGGGLASQSGMSCRWNYRGDQILALRRRMPPALFSVATTKLLCQFDHQGYYNSCTMKSCCFAGENDEYVVSGSDDFNVYMWKIPDVLDFENSFVNEAHTILRGHRSIVNQARYNPSNGLIATSGVEKVVKVWSPFSIGAIADDQERPIYSHEEYINLVLRSGALMTHDYSQESTEEDPRMMAFFDSLVQRELEGWSDSSDSSDGGGGLHNSNAEDITDRVRLQFYESVLRSQPISEVEDEVSDSDTTSVVDDVNHENGDDSGNQSSSSHHAVLENVAIGAQQILDAIDRVQRELDALSDHDEGATNGVSATQNKRSISELIAQKRKENEKKLPKKKLKLLPKKKSDSSSSTSVSSLSSSSSESELDTSQGSTKIMSRNQPSMNSKLKRLKRMRQNVLESNSESDDNDSAQSLTSRTSKQLVSDNQSVKNGLSKSRRSDYNKTPQDGVSASPTDKCSVVDCSTDSPGADSAIGHSSYKSSTPSSLENGMVSTSLETSSSSTPSGSHSSFASSSKKSSISSDNGALLNTSQSTSGSKNSVSSHSDNGVHPSTSQAPSSGSPVQDNQPTWTKFKRFRNRLEKARRHYRDRESQSSEDESKNNKGKKKRKH